MNDRVIHTEYHTVSVRVWRYSREAATVSRSVDAGDAGPTVHGYFSAEI